MSTFKSDDPMVTLGDRFPPGVTRRRFVVTGAQGALAVAGAAALGGCGSTSSTRTTAASAKPVYGGTLTLGMLGAGTAEQLAPSGNSNVDVARTLQLYDRLFDLHDDFTLKPTLCLSAEPNADASVWTLKLRDGVVWHNGRPFTADDVVYSMQSWQKSTSLTYGYFTSVIDYSKVRKLDRLTVEVPLVSPFGQFPSLTARYSAYGITPAGMTIAELQRHPVGTGPFKFESFKPGVQSTFVANHDYWDHGKPYVDRLVINSSFTDNNALYNALLSGSIDVLAILPAVYAKQQESSGQVNVLHGDGHGEYFYMNVNKAPFNDVRVRQAMRLIADRPALVQDGLSGFGQPANDLFGLGCQYFASDLQRSQDIEQAKSLLKAAGREGLSVTVSSSSAVESGVGIATLFAEQAKAAGVNVSVKVISSANYYNASNGWPYLFGQDDWEGPFPSLSAWYRTTFVEYPETGWNVANDKALNAAFRAVDPSVAAGQWRAVQEQQFNEGGFLVWGYPENLDATSKNVAGLTGGPLSNINGYQLLNAWLVHS